MRAAAFALYGRRRSPGCRRCAGASDTPTTDETERAPAPPSRGRRRRAVKAALATAKSSTFWEVTTAFIAGGCSSGCCAFAGAVYTYGEENVRCRLKLVRRMVLRSWELFVAGLGAAKDKFLTPGAGRKGGARPE